MECFALTSMALSAQTFDQTDYSSRNLLISYLFSAIYEPRSFVSELVKHSVPSGSLRFTQQLFLYDQLKINDTKEWQ
jgi:hypothetical protein